MHINCAATSLAQYIAMEAYIAKGDAGHEGANVFSLRA